MSGGVGVQLLIKEEKRDSLFFYDTVKKGSKRAVIGLYCTPLSPCKLSLEENIETYLKGKCVNEAKEQNTETENPNFRVWFLRVFTERRARRRKLKPRTRYLHRSRYVVKHTEKDEVHEEKISSVLRTSGQRNF